MNKSGSNSNVNNNSLNNEISRSNDQPRNFMKISHLVAQRLQKGYIIYTRCFIV